MINKTNQKIEKIYDDGTLLFIFSKALNRGTIESPNYFFSNIYAPVVTYNASGVETKTYTNIGVTPQQITNMYVTKYAPFYLLRDVTTISGYDRIVLFIKSVLEQNMYKYLQLIYHYGLEWNPLWNVDADERYAHIDAHGIKETTNEHTVNMVTTKTTDQTVTNSSRDYAGDDLTDDTSQHIQNTESDDTHNNEESTVEDNQDKITEEHKPLTEKDEEEHDVPITIKEALNPLECTVNKIDDMHVERHIRQGNIGVTKTTELLEDARNYVRWNIIEEFFNDINEVILIGVMD